MSTKNSINIVHWVKINKNGDFGRDKVCRSSEGNLTPPTDGCYFAEVTIPFTDSQSTMHYFADHGVVMYFDVANNGYERMKIRTKQKGDAIYSYKQGKN